MVYPKRHMQKLSHHFLLHFSIFKQRCLIKKHSFLRKRLRQNHQSVLPKCIFVLSSMPDMCLLLNSTSHYSSVSPLGTIHILHQQKDLVVGWMGGSSFTDFSTKDELPQEGILFCTQSSSLGIFINKKVLLTKIPREGN